MKPSGGAEPPHQEPARNFQGWQRRACLILVGLLLLLTILLVITATLGALGVG
ncbi:MAG TPA: hypothetical protein VNH82_07295 [Candidatus Dormibacteraeota bacterium]|nr:hypothetical protein [Candidatus Dormibacteraeota bacterium]